MLDDADIQNHIMDGMAVEYFVEAENLAGMGKTDAAIVALRQAISIDPCFANAFLSLGFLLHKDGRLVEAIESYVEATAIQPNYFQAHFNLGNIFKEQGRQDAALASYQKVITINPGVAEAHICIGDILQELGQWENALKNYQKAITINPHFAGAYNNLGNAYKELGRLDEAVINYRKALDSDPGFIDCYINMSIALEDLGRLDEAVQVLQTAMEKYPRSKLIADYLIDILNYYMPNTKIRGAHAKAQEALQQLPPVDVGTSKISSKTVQHLYRQCHDILANHGMGNQRNKLENWRGVNFNQGCRRHMKVFDTFNVIPEYCFGCYKVLIKPRSVVELIKLLLVFDHLELPSDNPRKCLVEARPKITGTYKGLIYCKSLDEAKEILKVVQKNVGEKISEKIPISLQRGCSEYPIAYPEYAYNENDTSTQMSYVEEWREHEDHVDNSMIGHKYPLVFDTHNHSGITLLDAIVMQTWLTYAAAIGDPSYLEISETSVEALPIEERPAFYPPEDG